MAALASELQVEVDFITRLLLDLHGRSFQKLLSPEGPWKRRWIRGVQGTVPPPRPDELESLLPSDQRREGNLVDSRKLIYLAFVTKEKALPILDMKWNLEREPVAELRFRFFLLHGDDGSERPELVGFRFDSPEGARTTSDNQAGNHDFWHCQMITEFKKDDAIVRKLSRTQTPSWIPIRQPAFPLPARRGTKGIGDLLAILLLSLYGSKQLERFRDLDGYSELSQRLKDLGIVRRSS